MENLVSSLKKTFIFNDFSDQELQQIVKLVKERFFRKNTIIFNEGDPGIAFYIIKSGKIKVYKLSSDGRELILGIFGENGLFGDVPVFDGGPYPATAETLTDVTVWIINRESFINLLLAHPQIALKIIRVLGKRLRQAHGFVAELALKNVPQRLASLLLKLASEYGQENESGIVIDLPLTRQELAELIGVSRETVIRELSKFSRAGVLSLDGKKIILLDKRKLELWANM